MHLRAKSLTEDWQKILILMSAGGASYFAARFIASGRLLPFVFLLFSAGVLFLFFKYREAFILSVLIINEEFFYLVSPDPSGSRQYQGLLYIILFLTVFWYFLKERKEVKAHFNTLVLVLLILVGLGVFNSYFQGQPLMMGLKAAKGYYLILFYFVFIDRKINTSKLYLFIILTGLGLTLLNNIQYILYGRLSLFHVPIGAERVGQLRFLVGDFFTIFSPLIALSEYFRTKKKWFLLAFAYMATTVIIQGLTRGVIFGLILTTLLMFFLFGQLNLLKAVLYGMPIAVLMIWLAPLVQSSSLREFYFLTKYEISTRSGDFGIRFDTYNYYFNEIKKSPVIGRGIWSDGFDIYMGENPQDVKYKGFHLADVGITALVFHTGLLGAAWLLWLFARIYRYSFSARLKIKSNIDPCLIGYFIFGLATIFTLNSFVHHRTIIYLALVLSLFSQGRTSAKDSQEIS
jgi:hypothetical protein